MNKRGQSTDKKQMDTPKLRGKKWYANYLYPQERAKVSEYVELSEDVQALDYNQPGSFDSAVTSIIKDLAKEDPKWKTLLTEEPLPSNVRLDSLRVCIAETLQLKPHQW